MRRLALVGLGLTALATRSPARADVDQPTGDAGGALPGLVRVGTAGPLARGFVITGLTGYGYLGPVLAADDVHHRGALDLAVSFRPIAWLAIAGRFNGRYDRHRSEPEGKDGGWVGDPRLAVRAGLPLDGPLGLAAHIGVWMPGAEAPSLEPSATTVDALALATYSSGAISFGVQGGFRYDRSAESAPDADLLSPADRMALGVSESHAALVGIGAALRIGSSELFADWSWDYLIGDRAPRPGRAPMRVGAGWRQAISEGFALQLTGEYSLADTDQLLPMEELYPVEPRFTAMAGATFRFGGGGRAREVTLDQEVADDPVPPAPTTGTVAIAVTGDGGAPLAAAEVELTPDGASVPLKTTTDASGRARFDEVARGPATVSIRHPDHVEKRDQLTVEPGGTADLAVGLERALPPGQIRGTVRAWSGKPLKAKLTIKPIGTTVQCDERGEFELDLPPAEYEVEIEAEGFKPQVRKVRIEQNGVTILNVDLGK
jgi:hypothetical protein